MRASESSHREMAFHLERAKRFSSESKLYHAAYHLGLAKELASPKLGHFANADTILPPSNRPRVGSSGTRQYYWRMYDAYVRKAGSARSPDAKAVSFRQRRYSVGMLTTALALRLQEAVIKSSVIQYSSAERLPGFVASNYDLTADAVVNGHSRFRELDCAGKELLGQALMQMRDDVASCLDTPWRIIGVKVWTTPPGKPPIGMYGWHGDDWVGELFKIMIYLTPMSRKNGSLEIISNGKHVFLESPDPGKWVLFRNSDLLHRGVPGTDFERVVIELTLSRALAFDLRLRFPGLNAHWPELPWIDILDKSYETKMQTVSLNTATTSSSLMKQVLSRLINQYTTTGKLFNLRRRAERLKRLYFSFHPQ
jgi:hypothetical protein